MNSILKITKSAKSRHPNVQYIVTVKGTDTWYFRDKSKEH